MYNMLFIYSKEKNKNFHFWFLNSLILTRKRRQSFIFLFKPYDVEELNFTVSVRNIFFFIRNVLHSFPFGKNEDKKMFKQ